MFVLDGKINGTFKIACKEIEFLRLSFSVLSKGSQNAKLVHLWPSVQIQSRFVRSLSQSLPSVHHKTLLQLQDMWEILHHELSHLSPHEHPWRPKGFQMWSLRTGEQIHRGSQVSLKVTWARGRKVFTLLWTVWKKVPHYSSCLLIQTSWTDSEFYSDF